MKIKNNDITLEKIENLIEIKVLEILGDPDCGLELRNDIKDKLKKRLENSSKRVSHKEVIKKFA